MSPVESRSTFCWKSGCDANAKPGISMGLKLIPRRRFMLGALGSAVALILADAFWIEPRWLKVRRIRLTGGKETHRVVHFTDLHHKGNRKFLEAVVRTINAQKADFVCFTGDIIGDLIEKPAYLDDALAKGVLKPEKAEKKAAKK